jgi:FAD/FMN-containing dehydrogenase
MLPHELKTIVGPRGWSTDERALEPHLNEWRQRITGKTLMMVSPNSTEEVGAVVAACQRAGVGVVPQGGNTGLCGGAIPDESGEQILLSMSRMNRIRSVDIDNAAITAEAGCILADVQTAARAVGRFFPLSLGAEGSCQIGGNLSTDAGGINVIRYGTARQQALGLEVVLADGTIWRGLRALRKDTAGYDMKQVFMGSEGTLGIITAATLKLYPDPGPTCTALAAIPSASHAVQLLGELQSVFPDRIQAFELISERCFGLVCRHIPGMRHPFDEPQEWYVLMEVATSLADDHFETALAGAMQNKLITDAILAKNAAEADELWRLRHSISESQRPEGACLKHDISVPSGQMAEFLERSADLLETMLPDARLVAFGHVGDGNLHYNVLQPSGADKVEFLTGGLEFTQQLYALIVSLGGSISAEHGIGVFKKDALLRYRSAEEINLMKTLKAALDPGNILNPGKVI